MPCNSPLDAWRPRSSADTKRLVFSPTKGLSDQYVRIPCGQCLGCRLDKANAWAIRCVHEASLHESSVFLTPTYSDEHLPADYSISVRELQLFHKRLRNVCGSFRYFSVGEYGDKGLRPHYHGLYFGLDFADKFPCARSQSGETLWESPMLNELWGKGLCRIGTVTFQSAGYCARYAVKKIGGERAAEHYTRVHPLSGRVCQVRPEFVLMSRRPGIGHGWFQQFKADAFPSDFLIVDGERRPVPPYYLRLLEEEERERMIAARRVRGAEREAREAEAHARSGYGQARLLTKDQAGRLRAERLIRELETEGVI